MTEFQLAAAIAYLENRDDLAAKDNYAHLDEAMATVTAAAQNLLDISMDIETQNVPTVPTMGMVHVGMDVFDLFHGQGPYKGSAAVYMAMVNKCPRDARLPIPDGPRPFNERPPF